jgi:hypothetical protein
MMNLGDTAIRQVKASSRPPRKKAAAPPPVKVAVRAVQLFGRWLRVSRRGVPVMSGCACGFDLAIELGELDSMILEFLVKKFDPAPRIQAFIAPWLAPDQRFSQGLQNMLQVFTTSDHGLSDVEVSEILDAMEVSIGSIEAYHG